MMKKIVFLGLMISSLTACSAMQNKNTDTPKIGIANPASEYCISQGQRWSKWSSGLLPLIKWPSYRRMAIF